jgi:hypothetical protein
MNDYVSEIMLSVGYMMDQDTIEAALVETFTIPIYEISGEQKRGPFIWIETDDNLLVQFLAWEKAQSYEDNINLITAKMTVLVQKFPNIIFEQVIYPRDIQINFYPGQDIPSDEDDYQNNSEEE